MKILLFMLLSSIAKADLVVAVIDSGFDTKLSPAPMCAKPLPDTNEEKHGTNVVDLIAQNAGPGGYCILMKRVFMPLFEPADYIGALMDLNEMHIDVLNLSIEGNEYNPIEARLIKKLLDKGVIVFAAAGNKYQTLSYGNCTTYPACDDPRIAVIGTYHPTSGTGNRVRIRTHSDYGCVEKYCMSGTSQATAIETGRFIKFLKEHE